MGTDQTSQSMVADNNTEDHEKQLSPNDAYVVHSTGTDLSPAQRIISNTTAPTVNHDGLPDFNPPDGGLRAWTQVLAAHLINCMTWGYASSFGVYQLHYHQTMPQLPASQISWVGSIQVFLAFGVCSISGRLSDAGYVRPAAAAGSLLAVFGTFMTSLCREYWQIVLAQGVCTGLGLGIIFMPAVSVVNSYFRKKKAFALALAAVGTSVGSLIFPSIIQYLTPQIGFPWAVRVAGFVALFITLSANLLLRPYLPPRKSGPLFELNAFRELPYGLFAFAAFLNFYVLYFSFFYINSYARDIVGFSTLESVNLLLITNALGIPARPIVGYLADYHIGPINVYICAMACYAIMIFVWMTVKDRTSMYVFCAFLGFFSGASQGTFVGALASLTKDPRKQGVRFGMVSSLCAFATLAGPPTAGAIIDQSHGSYRNAQIWGGCTAACGCLFATASRLSRTGLRWKVKM